MRFNRYCSIWIAVAVFSLCAITAPAQSNVVVSVMAANLTSGNNQSYLTPGLDIFQGLEPDIVAIQDAARPCTSAGLIAATIEAARQFGAAVAAQPVADTIKESRDGQWVERTLDRSRLWTVQTPQTFRVEVIRRALAEVSQRHLLVTDDTAACELIGQPVKLIVRHRPNPKVTRPDDLPYVEWLLRQET